MRTAHRSAFEKAFGRRLSGDEIEYGSKSAPCCATCMLGLVFVRVVVLGCILMWCDLIWGRRGCDWWARVGVLGGVGADTRVHNCT